MTSDDRDGLAHLYYGPGKGKTTAAVGLAIRAVGHGLSVSIRQFMKGAEEMRDQYGEVQFLSDHSGVTVEQFPAGHARSLEDLSDAEHSRLEDAVDAAETALREAEADLVVLDELLAVTDLGVVDGERVVEVLDARARPVEVVVTGRTAPPAVVDAADYVSYIGNIKHPFQRGIGPKRGVEY
jgi:cob(I)alamin adenosyltransferase